MEKFLNFIWELTLSPQEKGLKIRKYIYQKLDYYVKNTSPGGLPPWTFWEKVEIISIVVVMLGLSSLFFFLLIFSKR